MKIDTSVTYLGLRLPHPFMPGASPLVDDLDVVRRLEDAGAAAIVMHSLFEEQIVRDQVAVDWAMDALTDSYTEATSWFPPRDLFVLGPESYMRHLEKVRKAVRVPVIASLNGVTPGRWLDFARGMEGAGADALELNVYELGAVVHETASDVEARLVELVRAVKSLVRIPVAVKLSPFYTSFANVARRLDDAGADGLVLFNRFFQPDLDPEELRVVPALRLSDSNELPLRLRWLAILSGRLKAGLAVTGGVRTAADAVKAVMAGAHAVQMVSELLDHGPERLRAVRTGFEAWMAEHGYESVAAMRGAMSLSKCPDPQALERANYAHVLQTWRPPGDRKS